MSHFNSATTPCVSPNTHNARSCCQLPDVDVFVCTRLIALGFKHALHWSPLKRKDSLHRLLAPRLTPAAGGCFCARRRTYALHACGCWHSVAAAAAAAAARCKAA